MFSKILVANRGEIAVRVMRTAKRLGVKTVAVYSEADAGSMHVDYADESYCIGPAAAAESYLNGDKIIQVAKQAGAQAIHPGFGFLSEAHNFANACGENSIEFIGPPVSSIVSMASKSESKKIMEAANVPCVPGYHGDQDMETLVSEAKRVGFPLMLKAIMGGGGKGMRIVEREQDLVSNIEACQREAAASFGDPRILLERYLRTPRHIEFQVFADKMGNTVHLYERDCSVQRRHQKVLEESPAPGMPPALRAKMGEAAVAAAKAVGYVGAGTVEFMLDDPDGSMSEDSNYFFLEMNTRLQVEHPITEMITGVDLVEWQLRVANGEELPIKNQADIPSYGHALEARVYAEAPGKGFLPASGKIKYLNEPKLDQEQYVYPGTSYTRNLRIETGIRQGDEISIFYDPMISKVVVHGRDRRHALAQMEQALSEYRVVGVPTNIEFLLTCIRHQGFIDGGVDTSFIEKFKNELLPFAPSSSDDANAAAVAVVTRSLFAARQREGKALRMPFGFRLGKQNEQTFTFELVTDDASGKRRVDVRVLQLKEANESLEYRVSVTQVKQDDEEEQKQEASAPIEVHVAAKLSEGGESGKKVTIMVDGVSCDVVPVVDNATNDMFLFDASAGSGKNAFSRLLYRVINVSKAAADGGAGAAGGATAPMPGKIIKIAAEEGQEVKKGETLVVMSAMKMEHEIVAPRNGIVKEISVSVGDQVEDGKVLCTVE